MKIGFIGTGVIARAMVLAINADGHDILISPRNAEIAEALTKHPRVSIASNHEIAASCDCVIICLLADVAQKVLPQLSFKAETKIISVMTDFPHEALSRLCHPAKDIAITIPLEFISKGGCPLPVFPASNAGLISEIFGRANPVIPISSENALNAHFAATALCSALLAQADVAKNWLAKFTLDEEKAEAYVVALVKAQFSNMPAEGILAALQSLSTEGGLNATLRAEMSGAEAMLKNAFQNLEARLRLQS